MANDELNKRVTERSNQIYSEAAAHGEDSRAVLCDRQTRLIQRFVEIAHHLDLNGSKRRVLEVGCGHGEFFKFLAANGYRGSYVGTDINADLLDVARRRFKSIDVRLFDIVEQDLGETFDYVVLSGVFNIDVGQDAAWVHRFLERMYAHAEEAIVFNAVSTYVNFRDPRMFYLDPVETFRFCVEKLSRRVTVAHHNLSYNYTVAVFKQQDGGLSCEE